MSGGQAAGNSQMLCNIRMTEGKIGGFRAVLLWWTVQRMRCASVVDTTENEVSWTLVTYKSITLL